MTGQWPASSSSPAPAPAWARRSSPPRSPPWLAPPATAVAVVKPAQTGVDRADPENSDVPDIETVTRLSGVADTHELARFPDPLSPEAAARMAGLPPLDMHAAADYIAKLAAERDLVLVEGAGGLLVRYDPAGAHARRPGDRAARQRRSRRRRRRGGLGTLNHTALTCEALRSRGLACAGVVVGSWPRASRPRRAGEPGRPPGSRRRSAGPLRRRRGQPATGRVPGGRTSGPGHRTRRRSRAAPSASDQRRTLQQRSQA